MEVRTLTSLSLRAAFFCLLASGSQSGFAEQAIRVVDLSQPLPGRASAGGPNIPLPQDHFDVTSVGPVQPIPKIGLLGLKGSPGSPDLVIRGLSFTPEGRVRYYVLNVGGVAASQPFVVDIYYNGQRRDTVKHNGLPPLSQQLVESSLASGGGCSSAQLRAIADSQETVAEADEANNSEIKSQVPPCPDLVVHIEKEETDTLHYRAKIKVTNKGTRAAGKQFIVLCRETSGPAGYILVPPADKRIEDLEAGASTTFHYGGNHLKSSAVGYHAIADRFDDVKESDESNNSTQRTLP